MKTIGIYICNNLTAFYKAVAFSKLHNDESHQFVYFYQNTHVSEKICSAIINEYDAKICHCDYRQRSFIGRYIVSINTINTLMRMIKQMAKGYEKIVLYVFLEHYDIMPTIIERFKSKYRAHGEVCLLEEGLGLYSPSYEITTKHLCIKRAINYLLHISNLNCIDGKHYFNPIVEKVYCSDPKKFIETGKAAISNIPVLYEGNLFTVENSEEFILKIGMNMTQIKEVIDGYDYIFLTQPIATLPYIKKYIDENKYISIIRTIFFELGNDKRILIKKHHLDRVNYDALKSENVRICDENINVVPFECLYPLTGEAQLLTFNSSCCNNISPKKKSIFMYRLLGSKEFNELCDSLNINRDKVIVADTIEDIHKIV